MHHRRLQIDTPIVDVGHVHLIDDKGPRHPAAALGGFLGELHGMRILHGSIEVGNIGPVVFDARVQHLTQPGLVAIDGDDQGVVRVQPHLVVHDSGKRGSVGRAVERDFLIFDLAPSMAHATGDGDAAVPVQRGASAKRSASVPHSIAHLRRGQRRRRVVWCFNWFLASVEDE